MKKRAELEKVWLKIIASKRIAIKTTILITRWSIIDLYFWIDISNFYINLQKLM